MFDYTTSRAYLMSGKRSGVFLSGSGAPGGGATATQRHWRTDNEMQIGLKYAALESSLVVLFSKHRPFLTTGEQPVSKTNPPVYWQ